MRVHFKHWVRILAWCGLSVLTVTQVTLHAGHNHHRGAWLWLESILFGVLFASYGYELWVERSAGNTRTSAAQR